jgi:hypothetical protein
MQHGIDTGERISAPANYGENGRLEACRYLDLGVSQALKRCAEVEQLVRERV